MEFKNVSPLGDLTIAVDGRPVTVEAGGKVEMTGEDAERLLEQPENWTRTDKPRKSQDEEK